MMCDSRAGLGGGERSVNGVNVRAVRKYFTSAYLQDVDMIFFPGDLINGHTASERDFREQLQAWKRIAEPVGHTIPIYETMGNHEFWKVAAETVRESRGKISTEVVFADEFVNPLNAPEPESDVAPPYTETVYSFDYGNSHFCMVNTNYW